MIVCDVCSKQVSMHVFELAFNFCNHMRNLCGKEEHSDLCELCLARELSTLVNDWKAELLQKEVERGF